MQIATLITDLSDHDETQNSQILSHAAKGWRFAGTIPKQDGGLRGVFQQKVKKRTFGGMK